jgi:prepilin-type N-terminal cleavage/methylation domain-containing protein
MMNYFKTKNNKESVRRQEGFTLVETLVATAIFVSISVSIYAGFVNILKIMNIIRTKNVMTSIANEQFEIVRNLSYSNVGTVNGIPSGIIPQSKTVNRDNKVFTVETVVRNFDDPFDGTFSGTPKDISPADMKLVELTITCTSCDDNLAPISFTTRVAPKNLETASVDGAIVIKVFDASGSPVSGANVNVVNSSLTPAVNINDETDINGIYTIVDAPPSVGNYQIIVTKDEYSTDRTYKTGGTGNPAHPTKPNLTVVVQQISQMSFTIDKTSTINFSTINNQCVATPNFDFTLSGSKLIGTNPNIIKYSNSFATDSGGILTLPDIEWDTYNIAGADSTEDIIGTNPLLSLGVNPNVEQDLQIITAPKNGRRLVVVIRDQSTGLPISDATVTVTGPNSYSKSYITSEGFLTQTDWSGGAGQSTYLNSTKFLDSDTNIDYSSSVGNLTLKKVFGNYLSSGYLTSSTFDTGGAGNFRQIIWSPSTQPSQAGTSSVRMQIATNNDNVTWNFTGPDGTATTYYNSTNQNISSSNNGNRYIRYRLFLSTSNQAYTPTISDISFTYTSLCIPPGQVSFSGLASGSYSIGVTKTGYHSTSKNITIATGDTWVKQEITISP